MSAAGDSSIRGVRFGSVSTHHIEGGSKKSRATTGAQREWVPGKDCIKRLSDDVAGQAIAASSSQSSGASEKIGDRSVASGSDTGARISHLFRETMPGWEEGVPEAEKEVQGLERSLLHTEESIRAQMEGKSSSKGGLFRKKKKKNAKLEELKLGQEVQQKRLEEATSRLEKLQADPQRNNENFLLQALEVTAKALDVPDGEQGFVKLLPSYTTEIDGTHVSLAELGLTLPITLVVDHEGKIADLLVHGKNQIGGGGAARFVVETPRLAGRNLVRQKQLEHTRKKVLDPGTGQQIERYDADTKSEMALLKQVQGHPNIMRIHYMREKPLSPELAGGAASSSTASKAAEILRRPAIFMEMLPHSLESAWAPGPDGRKDMDRVMRTNAQLLSGVAHCHEQGVQHRDLKPGNVRLDAEGNVKIFDFGAGHAGAGAEPLTYAGTPVYSPQDALLDKDAPDELPILAEAMQANGGTRHVQAEEQDVYASALMVFQSLHPEGKLPSNLQTLLDTSKNSMTIFYNLASGKVKVGASEEDTAELCEVFGQMKDPVLEQLLFDVFTKPAGQRPTAKQLAEASDKYRYL